jgi:hypothetical protein
MNKRLYEGEDTNNPKERFMIHVGDTLNKTSPLIFYSLAVSGDLKIGLFFSSFSENLCEKFRLNSSQSGIH